MPKLLIHEGTYYAQLDEQSFYSWLQAIVGVRKIEGTPNGLIVTLRSSRLSESSLRDLLALHWRYRLPMKDLAQFKNARNESWFAAPNAYWYAAVFGPRAVSANLDSRLRELHAAGSTASRAAATIQREYLLQHTNEAERRVAVSKLWADGSTGKRPKPLQHAKGAA